MLKPSVKCALLAAMIAKRRWGTPIDEESLLSISAIDKNDHPVARRDFHDLQHEPYVTIVGRRRIELESGEFGASADVLYDECGWEPHRIKSRLEHYEGGNRPDWA